MKEFYSKNKIIQKSFFLRKTDSVAKDLLGKILVRKFKDTYLAGRIVETEAYMPEGDMANHSAIAQTPRNAPMREEGGILYVYKIYGIHHCVNIVTEEKGKGCAVLLRALEPLRGIEEMQILRGRDDRNVLCKGPGNLTKAMNFSVKDNYKSITDNNEIFLIDTVEKPEIVSDVRVGISKSKELSLRFYIKYCKFVSVKSKKDKIG